MPKSNDELLDDVTTAMDAMLRSMQALASATSLAFTKEQRERFRRMATNAHTMGTLLEKVADAAE